MRTVFVLQHAYELEGREEMKFIGVYSSTDEGQKAIEQLKAMPGFCDTPEDFHLTEYELDRTHWQEGFAVMTSINIKDKNGNWIVVGAVCLPNGVYRIAERYNSDELGEFKHDDLVTCEDRDGELYAVALAVKEA